MDLADIASVDAAAEQLKTCAPDVLICNAGAYAVPRFVTSSGLDNVFQINFAAPYYLIRRLMPHMAEKHGRVVVVGSVAHNYSKADPCDVDFRTRTKSSLVYGNAKRYLMFSMYALFEGRGDVTVSVTHPGIAVTGITAHYPKWLYALIKYPMKVIFMKPRRASLSILRGIFEATDSCEWIGPRVFDVWGLPCRRRLNTCDEQERALICKEAERIYRELCAQTGKGAQA
jgi:NAD(P)-dependent dehydrogenase (short-subunit alcohol dehydrogenase family)